MLVLKEFMDIITNVKPPKNLPAALYSIYFQQGVYWENGKGGILNKGLGIMNKGLGILTNFNSTLDGNIIGKMTFPKTGKILAAELNRLSRYFVDPMKKLGSSFVCVMDTSQIKSKKGDWAMISHDLRAASTLTDDKGNRILIRCLYEIEDYIG